MIPTKHLGARLHRAVYGLFRKSDRQEAINLYERAASLLRSNGLASKDGIEERCLQITHEVADTLSIPEERHGEIHQLVRGLIDYEAMFMLPDLDFSENRTVAELWELSAELKLLKERLEKTPAILDALTNLVITCFASLKKQLPDIPAEKQQDGIAVPTSRIDRIADLSGLVETFLTSPFDQSLEDLGILTRLRGRLEANLVAASGGNPRDVEGFGKPHRMPKDFKANSKRELVGAYLAGTPLLNLFEGEEVFVIPQETRFEHHHIIAGSGHGKTQTLQYLIGKDLKAVAEGNRSIIVIDSQGDLIRKVSRLKYFAPGEPLHDRICIIDPTDIEWPVSLNLFDAGLKRLSDYPMLERERLTNSILELYDFVLGSLLSAEMTQKQSVIFRYVTRLMLQIPNATIHTLIELMQPGSEVRFAEHIAKLEGSSRRFFETEFVSREFSATKQQVLRRLWGIMEKQTFERMFSHPGSKLDLFSEMNAGKVILINTAKDLLKEGGTEIFGRFFIAMIAQAAQERATLPESRRMDTMVYIDEAADYFDRNIGVILSQARKYRVGMVLAHQYLGQLDTKLQDAFSANTSVKFAGGFVGREARSAAHMLNCSPELIEAQPKGAFAAFVRGLTPTAVPLQFPFGKLEELPQMTSQEWYGLRDKMRERYAVHYKDLGKQEQTEEDDDVIYARDESSRDPYNSSNGNDDPDNPDTSPSDRW